jgi:hypothetical protein
MSSICNPSLPDIAPLELIPVEAVIARPQMSLLALILFDAVIELEKKASLDVIPPLEVIPPLAVIKWVNTSELALTCPSISISPLELILDAVIGPLKCALLAVIPPLEVIPPLAVIK